MVQPSGQPIRRSPSSGVMRRTVHDDGAGIGGTWSWVSAEGAGGSLFDVEALDVFLDPGWPSVLSGWDRANDSSAAPSSPGSCRPRFPIRRVIPCAARADTKNRSGAVGVRMSASVEGEEEHPLASLGHAEPLPVQNPVGPPVPDVAQRTEEGVPVQPTSRREDARDVLEKDGSGPVLGHKVKPDGGEAGPVILESAALSGDAEPLARWSSGPDVGAGPLGIITASAPTSELVRVGTPGELVPSIVLPPASTRNANGRDVPEVGDVGPVPGEDGAGVGFNLAVGDDPEAGTLQPKVKASDSGEPAGDGGTNSTSWLLVASVSATPSDSNGPFPPPGFPSRIRMMVGPFGSVGCRLMHGWPAPRQR